METIKILKEYSNGLKQFYPSLAGILRAHIIVGSSNDILKQVLIDADKYRNSLK